MYVCGVLFFCLFIDFACELVWNVLVNQTGFFYINNNNSLNILSDKKEMFIDKLFSVSQILKLNCGCRKINNTSINK